MEELLPKPVREPRAVLFDMDGVLVDSMPVHALTWHETAVKYGLKAEKNEFYDFEGMKGADTITLLYRRTYGRDPDPALTEEIYAHKSALFASHKGEMPVIPGAADLMKELKGRGIGIGVVTGSTLHNTLPRIERYYSEYLDESRIITADLAGRGKPYPDPYLAGVKLFGLPEEDFLVVENAPLGIRSARAAGLFTAAVTTGPIPGYKLRAEGANLIFRNMYALGSWWICTFKR